MFFLFFIIWCFGFLNEEKFTLARQVGFFLCVCSRPNSGESEIFKTLISFLFLGNQRIRSVFVCVFSLKMGS